MDRAVDKVSMVSASCFETVDFIARVARDRCVPFGDMQVVFAGDFFYFLLSPTQMIDRFAFVLLCGLYMS